MRASIVLLLFAGAVRADFDVPVQTITGAEKPVPPGELCSLKLSPIGTAPKWMAAWNARWKVFAPTVNDKGVMELVDKAVIEHDGGVFFGTGLRSVKLTAIASVTYLYVVKDDKGNVTDIATRTAFLTATVTISGNGPTPPDPPKPDPPVPPVDPVFPDGKYKLSAFSYWKAKNLVADRVNRQTSAKALAQSFRSMAAKINAGLTDPAAILTQTHDSNVAALGASSDDWHLFWVALRVETYGLYSRKLLTTPNDFQTAWLEIAAGLDKVSP